MATSKRKPRATTSRSTQIAAGKTKDAEFLALLRRKCLRAASVGALTAAGESIPGLSRVLGFVFGELLDARFLSQIQRELIDDTFELYGLDLPKPVHDALVSKVQMLGTSASIASDAVIRQLLKSSVGRFGGVIGAGRGVTDIDRVFGFQQCHGDLCSRQTRTGRRPAARCADNGIACRAACIQRGR